MTANRFRVPVKIDLDLIRKGMEELRRILDQIVESNRNLDEQQKLAYKSGNAWFVNECYMNLMARCVVLKDVEPLWPGINI